MREKTVTIFKFEELSECAKEKARDWWREHEADDFGSDPDHLEPAETAARLLGIELDTRTVRLHGGDTRTEPVIFWSGFSTPGSGASFHGDWKFSRDAVKAIREEFPKDETLHDLADRLMAFESAQRLASRPTGYAHICQGGNEVHEYSMSADVYDSEDNELGPEDEAQFLEIMRDFARWIYKGLEAEYNYRMSDEAVDESIIANEYEFDEDGDRA